MKVLAVALACAPVTVSGLCGQTECGKCIDETGLLGGHECRWCEKDKACYTVGVPHPFSSCSSRQCVSKSKHSECEQKVCPTPAPTPAPPTPAPTPSPTAPACLCVFDVDRTLTGKQAAVSQCPADLQKKDVKDSSYGGGDLVLSDAAQHIEETFCMNCYKAIVTATEATGSPEHTVLRQQLGKGVGADIIGKNDPNTCESKTVTSPFVICWPDGKKQEAIPDLISWYDKNANVTIAKSDVYMFDDRDTNIKPFQGTGYNARQISCSSRDTSTGGVIGLCGAKATEIVKTKGVQTCKADDEVVV